MINAIYHLLSKQAFVNWYEGDFIAHIEGDEAGPNEDQVKQKLKELLRDKPYVLAMSQQETGGDIVVTIHDSYDAAMAAFLQSEGITNLDQDGIRITVNGRSDDKRATIAVHESSEEDADLWCNATIYPIW